MFALESVQKPAADSIGGIPARFARRCGCYTLLPLLLSLLFFASCHTETSKYTGWEAYGGSKENNHYSSLTQIDTNNVQQLKISWVYNTGDADTINHTQIQCNPVMVDGVLYGTSPRLKLFALEAFSGKLQWLFDPADFLNADKKTSLNLNNCRGVTYWSDKRTDKRIFYTTGSYLNCINAVTGRPVEAFGENGRIDLHNGLGENAMDLYVTSTSPGIIYKDLIIVGTRVDEGPAAAPGHIRAFDVRTGDLRWIFHTVPQPGEYGYDTWDDTAAYKHIGGANAWSGFSMDEDRGILFASTGSASYDFYGGKRTGNNLFADCLLAIDAATGKRIWHFQDIHHNVWDKDLPAPPALLTINKNGKKTDIVAQTTKTGFIFLFERQTGKPIYPVEEKPVTTVSELTGEKLSPTQPVSVGIEPFTRQSFTEADLNHLLRDSSFNDIKQRFKSYKNGFIFTPPSKQGTVIFPGFDGAAEWGGPAADTETGILYVNANEMPWVLTMVDVETKQEAVETNLQAGVRLYTANCMACHGAKLQGSGNFPSLININTRYDESQFYQLLSSGRRMMPAFKQLTVAEQKAIASYVLQTGTLQKGRFEQKNSNIDTYRNLAYTSTGYNKFLSKEGLPAIAPPWGTLNAIDLKTGKLLWKDTLGDHPAFKAKGIHTGTENYGGPVVTAGGLLFIAATPDHKLRAYNKRTGALLKEFDLPGAGFATPAVYEINGKQFIVIACGGGKLGTKSTDAYVAFSL